ncbi:MAG: hypothetical protein OXF89_13475 [Rhodospirillaceae bacterium]|nr:hypothetical protein [Rhodospirillaceae bacterium]MCY4064866.1 hypothetical protein [Rhodospirillaceae bacterium]
MKPGSRGGIPLDEESARLLGRLRAEPLPEEPRAAAALRRATQAAFAILEQVRKLAERRSREPEEIP